MRIRDLAYSRPRYGYRRLLVLLQREGVRLNHKLMYRLIGRNPWEYGENEHGVVAQPKCARIAMQGQSTKFGAWISCRISSSQPGESDFLR